MKYSLISLSISAFLGVATLSAQQKIPMYGSNDNGLLCDQARVSLQIADRMLDAYPPTLGAEPLEREAALELIDNVLHDTRNDYSPSIIEFAESRIGKVLADFDNPIAKDEMRVYKLYNAGTLVRTDGATVAFDIVRGRAYPTDGPVVSDSLMLELVGKADIMFLSHNHGDHIDPVVGDMFLNSGKQVVSPAEGLVENHRVIHIAPGDTVRRAFELPNGATINTVILPAHQDDMQNNISVVTFPNGMTVAQTGDLWNRNDIEWVSHASQYTPAIDLLLLNCWVNSFDEVLGGFAPRVLVTYHENELGHSIGHREPYMLSRRILRSPRPEATASIPSPLLSWGEWITIASLPAK